MKQEKTYRILARITVIIYLVFTTGIVNATDVSYKLLAPLGKISSVQADTSTGFSDYLQLIINITIGLTGAIAVIMLIVGGLEYVFSSVSETAKKDAKERVTNAIVGVLIVLSGYLILSTINPKLLSLKLPTLPSNESIQTAAGKPTPTGTPAPTGATP